MQTLTRRMLHIGRVATNVATVNILLEPPIADTHRRQRTEDVLADLAAGPTMSGSPPQKDAESAWSTGVSKHVARCIMQRFSRWGCFRKSMMGRAPKCEWSVASLGWKAWAKADAQHDTIRSFESRSETAKSRSEWKAQRRAGRSARRKQKKAAKTVCRCRGGDCRSRAGIQNQPLKKKRRASEPKRTPRRAARRDVWKEKAQSEKREAKAIAANKKGRSAREKSLKARARAEAEAAGLHREPRFKENTKG